jgi:hypothetical protein
MLADRDIASRQPRDVIDSAWLGYAGASEEQIRVAETRLGVSFPPSYRQFLETSNGWRNVGAFIYNLWPTADVNWFAVRNQQWIDAYATPYEGLPSITDAEYLVYGDGQDSTAFRPEYLQNALEISDTGDSAILLLNPVIVTSEGEWEAWFFANWNPGARRYRSFQDLMQQEHSAFIELRDSRDTPRPRPPGLLSVLWREIRQAWRSSRETET